MCGFVLARGYPEKSIDSALDRMHYRGRDGKRGLSTRGGWTLGHVRLAIQDLSDKSKQPWEGEHTSIAFVGEIFNHNSDSELLTLVNTYLSNGPQGFHEFDGFWSVAAIDDLGNAEVITDYLGQKPVYWWREKQIACSEIEPMFALASVPDFDEVYLSNVVKFGYDMTGRTPYRGIVQIAPGCCLQIDGGIGNIQTYWDWDEVPGSSGEPTPAAIRSAIEKATIDRTIGDRDVAILVSGGLDSTIVHSILKANRKKVFAVSIENGESEFLPDDVELLPNEPDDIGEALRAMQVPVDLGSVVPQYTLASAIARRGFNVCMSGDGADELFGGYRRALEYDSQASDIFMELPYYHLPRLDRVMMKKTIELRSPFLSPRVIRLAMQVPYCQRIDKTILKVAFADLVPRRIIQRKKHPLKTSAVIAGGTQYRVKLVNLFKERMYANSSGVRFQ